MAAKGGTEVAKWRLVKGVTANGSQRRKEKRDERKERRPVGEQSSTSAWDFIRRGAKAEGGDSLERQRTTTTATTERNNGGEGEEGEGEQDEDEATVANSERISQMIASGSRPIEEACPADGIGKRTKVD
ncbi:hypothetical protein TWF730_002835 [Orbilia blumenaviensis]|uniref:Uncharacterized protein n=1 Tax=Orbilia blumenaviensis TaxID=1796055 RepID=A0AAV9U9X6_9PEZI